MENAGAAAIMPAGQVAPAAVAASGSAPASPAAVTPVSAVATPATSANTPAIGMGLAMDECGLKTNYLGDEYCILPPPADMGFQLHIGPTNYENPEATYILQPGEENVVNLSAVSGNDKDIVYYYRQYRMRPGSHHVILTADERSIGGTQNLARDNPERGVIPPENNGIGLPLKAKATINANMHFYNFSDKPMLRELWVNYWYKDPATVTETANRIFSMTGVRAAVAHSHVVVGASCQITGNGRVLSLAGHRHSNNVRFSVWHKTGEQRTLVFDDYDAEHPGFLEFNSLVTNPLPDPATKKMGGVSGMLNVKAGDTLDFECEIINTTDKNFVGQNEAADDEMCILTGDSVGATVPGRCTAIEARRMDGATAR
jgi:hypothetical protein